MRKAMLAFSSAARTDVSTRALNISRLLSNLVIPADLVKEASVGDDARFGEKENYKELELINTFVNKLKACAYQKDLSQGCKIHADICNQGLLRKHTYLEELLVNMYVKCGAPIRAQQVLDCHHVRNVISWTKLISAYTQRGLGKEALGCFDQMQREGISPNSITYTCVLKACGIVQDLKRGEKIHGEIVGRKLLDKDVVLGTGLVDMYAKCGALMKAQEIFDELPIRNVTSWSVLMAGNVRNGYGKEALGCFQRMRKEGFCPDAVTYSCILKACSMIQDITMGEQIHDEIVSQGLLDNNLILGNALVDMYAKCGVFVNAKKVLDELSVRDVASWGGLMAGYVRHGLGQEALDCFHRMQKEGLSPDAITYSSILKACGITQDIDMGKKIHNEVACQGLLKNDVVVGTALIDMYGKCGKLKKAQKVFDQLTVRTVPSWSALIAGYAQHGHGKEALGCFHRMQKQGLTPNENTYTSALKACGITQDIDTGEKIHNKIFSQCLLANNVILGNALVDMYAKCGIIKKAQDILDELPVRSVSSWNALIAGYAQEGKGQEALNCFKQMRKEGLSPNVVSWNALIGGYAQQGLAEEALLCFRLMQQEGTPLPDAITFVNVLKACSHAGLVDEGQMFFDNMKGKYGIMPDEEHCTCMVDMFGRARLFDKATRVIKMMPSSDYPPIWSALLSACRKWGNVKLGRLAFQRGVQLNGCNPALYVLMSDIYVAAGMHEEAQYIENMGMENAA